MSTSNSWNHWIRSGGSNKFDVEGIVNPYESCKPELLTGPILNPLLDSFLNQVLDPSFASMSAKL